MKVRRMPGWMLKGLGFFNPVLRELREMQYQFDHPFVMSDARIRGLLGLEPTSLSVQVAATARWLRGPVAS